MNDIYKSERVSVISGKNPVICIAPHCEEDNTDLIAEYIASTLNCYAIINRGFKRATSVDVSNDQANCNNIEHCHHDIVKEEFLDPIFRFKNRILKKWQRVCIVYIHGMGNNIRKKVKNLDYVIGWGNGNPASHSCQKWIKNLFLYHLSIGESWAAEGASGGQYAGWAKNNMNQLFRSWYFDEEVDSLQIEIVRDLRNTIAAAQVASDMISMTLDKMLNLNHWKMPVDFEIIKA